MWMKLVREAMGRLGIGRKVLECFSFSLCASTCVCMHALEDEVAIERKVLVKKQKPDQVLRLKDLVDETRTLAFQLEPKTVELKVSMHCHGCARKVQKHISKMEGVTSFEVDLERKKVVVMGNITPFEVLQSISKVKVAELWMAPKYN